MNCGGTVDSVTALSLLGQLDDKSRPDGSPSDPRPGGEGAGSESGSACSMSTTPPAGGEKTEAEELPQQFPIDTCWHLRVWGVHAIGRSRMDLLAHSQYVLGLLY